MQQYLMNTCKDAVLLARAPFSLSNMHAQSWRERRETPAYDTRNPSKHADLAPAPMTQKRDVPSISADIAGGEAVKIGGGERCERLAANVR